VELSQRARVRAGDHDEFGVLFSEHARAVYNHAFRLTGNWSAAEEVVSLTFLEAWRLRGTVRPDGGSLLPWLLGIALNVARNVSRAARRQQAAMNRLPKTPDVPDFADDLAGRIDDAERLERSTPPSAPCAAPSGTCSPCACGPA
jgi:DNA-directed RNA polymerase specialized sigma24 family protein